MAQESPLLECLPIGKPNKTVKYIALQPFIDGKLYCAGLQDRQKL